MTESDTTDITEINDSEISEISDHDLQVGITLCSLTYLDEDDSNPDKQLDGIKQYLAYPDLPTAGSWSVVWGPASFEENMWFIAQNRDTGNFALVIRGTVMSSLAAKLGDIDIVPVTPQIKNVPQGVTIARGLATAHGRLDVAPDKWTDRTAWQFLTDELTKTPRVTLDVIGHSLGGALAPIIALDAMQRFPRTVVRSLAFAGMSPGNKAFSDWYVSSLHHQQHSRFINPLDIIPQWYAGLSEMRNGFPGNGAACPEAVCLGIDALLVYMLAERVSYQATPNPKEFLSSQYPVFKWADQCHAQHEHLYYMLMTGISLEVIHRRFPRTPQWMPPGPLV